MVLACQTANAICSMEGDFKSGLWYCLFASTVIYRESTGHCMFMGSLFYGRPSYYFLLVWVLILHICKQLCSYAAVLPQRPYAFPC
jgi:hypothetical protein